MTLGSGSFDLNQPAAGLSDLASYTATLTLTFDGTNAGQPSKWSITYVMLVTKDPSARQITIEKTGDFADPSPVIMAEMDGASYEQHGQSPCTADLITADNPLAERFEPAGFLGTVIGAVPAGTEEMNGTSANHFTFDQGALGQGNSATSTGEMWVAADGGYVVKYVQTTKAKADFFGEGIEGTLSLDYELAAVNQTVTVALPVGCPAGLLSGPTLPDASNIESVPGVLTFDTASSLADVATFYQNAVPSLGWTPGDDPTMSDTTLLVEFTRGDETLSIDATTDAGVTSVSVSQFATPPVATS